MSLIIPTPWTRQPLLAGASPKRGLGLTALILPGQANVDLVSGISLSSITATPTPTVGIDGPALQLNANNESIWTTTSLQQRTPSQSMVWVGQLRSGPSQYAAIGGITFAATNVSPYSAMVLSRRIDGVNNNIYLGFAVSAGAGDDLQSTSYYTDTPCVIVGVVESGRQLLLIKTPTSIEERTKSVAATISYSTSPRIMVGDSFNARNPSADCALLAHAGIAWSKAFAYQVLNNPWGQLFAPSQRRIWIGTAAVGGSFKPYWAKKNSPLIGAGKGY